MLLFLWRNLEKCPVHLCPWIATSIQISFNYIFSFHLNFSFSNFMCFCVLIYTQLFSLSLCVTWLAVLITYTPRPLTHLIRSVLSTQAERCLLIAALHASSLIQWNWIMEVCSDPSRGQRSSRNGQFAGLGPNWYDIRALDKSEFLIQCIQSSIYLSVFVILVMSFMQDYCL